MKKLITFAPLLALLLAGCSAPNSFLVRVTDAEGMPVANAKVMVGWSWYNMAANWNWNISPQVRSKEGETNEKGEYAFFGFTRGEIGISASKDGYYSGGGSDPRKVILRRQEHPVPMYAKKAWFDLPSGDGDYGYDLLAGDLVSPSGVGTNSDLIFRVSTTNSVWNGRQYKHLQADIIFPRAGDGIQIFFVPRYTEPGSEYRFPFSAPASEYQSSLTAANGNTQDFYNEYHRSTHRNVADLPPLWLWLDSLQLPPGNPDRFWEQEVNYFFKVRSDSGGRAYYGFINGPIRPDYRGGEKPSIQFTYFVNPDNTRNIEFDSKRNLLKRFSRYEDKPGFPW